MSAAAENNLSLRNRLLSGMQAMRSLVEPEGDIPPCEAIDWRLPRRLDAEAKEKLRLFSVKLAAGLEKTMEVLTGQPFAVTARAIGERYASHLFADVQQEQPLMYYLPLTSAAGKGHAGFLQLSLETAGRTVGYMLRDPETEIGKKERISPLGETILLDAMMTMADAISDGFTEYGQAKLEKTEHLVYVDWPVRFSDLEDLCEFSFSAVCGQVTLSITLIVLDETLAGIAGLTGPFGRVEEKRDNSDRVVKRMHDAPMTVTALLSASLMTLNDMMALSIGDVVVLDRKISEPIEVMVNGQACFTAWPAASDGHYACAVAATKIGT